MSTKTPILDTFDTMEEAIDAIQMVKWTGRDVDQLSIAGKDWMTQLRTEKNKQKGDMVEIGSYYLPFSDQNIHRMQTARFYCQDVGGVVLAGPLSNWVLGVITSSENDDGLNALGVGLADLGLSDDEILACKTAVRDGKILVVIPAKKQISTEHGDKLNTKIRISDMAKYR